MIVFFNVEDKNKLQKFIIHGASDLQINASLMNPLNEVIISVKIILDS